MSLLQFKKWNTILSWCAFLISFVVYSLTVEPTVSYWDAGEYILTSAKLQVGHPPGAPLFQMLGAIFSIFAFNPSQIGLLMNMMSAASSAFTILFMFWSIVMLLKKIVKNNTSNKKEGSAILGSAFVGSLTFAFTDSFWFNAVETEVYAMATLIMAVMFYLGLRWEQDMDTPKGNKWLILISFVVGLSFGVHFMGLLTIPALGLIYFFKNYKKVTVKNFIVANITAVAILFFVFKLLAPNILRYFSVLEIFFVNSIGLPFNSGSIFAFILLIAAFYYALKYTRQKALVHLNTGVLCLLFIMIGFSSWLMLPIRANANVVVNENNPSSARELLAYYNLEQYPETHLFYGPLFTDIYTGADEDEPYVDDKPKYEKDKKTGKYIIVNDYKQAKQNFNSEQAAILPRMWSSENAKNYFMFTGYLDFTIKPEYRNEKRLIESVTNFKNDIAEGAVDYEDYDKFLRQFGQYLDIKKPSIAANIAFLIEYQLGYMYWRYFMWNFTGRQDDLQGRLDNHGNWLSGIKFIDKIHLGASQDNLPSDVKNNKARNTYYFLPLLLGLIGFFFLFNKDKKLFWVTLVFFLFTGLAIQVYTNVRPFEPRERDYSVVGSFYVFSMWIGLGVYAIYDYMKLKVKHDLLAPAISVACLLLVPGIIISNNWDDHDRSGKYTAKSMAKRYLDSCAENAILFSIGDNDTFALWYAQEIEGYRTDVRVVNTSLFQTDWYIDQMKRKAYESDPIPSKLTHWQYRHGTRDYISKRLVSRDTLMIDKFMDFISSDNPKTKLRYIVEQDGGDPSNYPSQMINSNYFPVENIRIPVNKSNVLKNGVVKQKDADKITSFIDVKITDNAIYKNRLLMLDIIANNDWKRPIYFTGGAFGNDDYIWMKDYLQLDGMTYKLVPIKTPVDRANPFDMGRIDTDLMFSKVTQWDWGNSGSDDIYHDPETRNNSITYRSNLARLIEALINEGKLKKAEKIADIAMTNMPTAKFGYYTLLEPYISAYYEVGAKEKAQQIYKDIITKHQEELNYYSSITIENQEKYFRDILSKIEQYKSLVDVLIKYDKDLAKTEALEFNNYIQLFDHFYKGVPGLDKPETDIKGDIEKNTSTQIKAEDSAAVKTE